MTIKQFQELYYISQSTDITIDKSIRMVSVVTGKSPERVESMKMQYFNFICKQINKQFEILGTTLFKGKPQKYIYVRGRVYRLRYDVRHINAGKYVEALTFSKDMVNNLHKIMATIAEPVKLRGLKFVKTERLHEDIASDMERVNFKAAYQCAVFFYTLYRVSMEITLPYLVKELMMEGITKEKATLTIQDSLKILDGFSMPKWSLNLKEYLLNRYGVLE